MNWLVVQTHPRSEELASLHLARQGFQAYCPKLSKQRRHARRVETICAPLFPRYLFVGFDSAFRRWRSIRSTVGVLQLVGFGDRPAVLAGSVVDGLKRREVDGLLKLPRRSFVVGEKVRIVDGAFADCHGLFEEMRDDERVCVLLDLLGRKVRVVLDELSISAA